MNVIISVSAPLHGEREGGRTTRDCGECAVECDHLSGADQSEFFSLGDYS